MLETTKYHFRFNLYKLSNKSAKESRPFYTVQRVNFKFNSSLEIKVDDHMRFFVAELRKSFSADVTLVRFLSGVSAHVRC